ncbi:hypothetical protein JOM56_002869 [Amanita muscaria]
MHKRPPYSGPHRKLVIAIDVGTTFSGVSYSILDPEFVPEINGVTRFPGQIHGALKIPTVLYYDTDGVAQAIGAEAVQDSIDEIAEENGWKKASWYDLELWTSWRLTIDDHDIRFKLHLRPKLDDEEDVKNALDPLPPGVAIVDMFADILRYLYRCTKEYIEQTHASGDLVWSALEKETHFVLTHPNGWGGFEQAQMRRAAINAGLIDDHHASEGRLSFATEGEASLNYCISSELSKDAFKDGKGVIIVDAGGGTVDISAYARTSEKNTYEEIAVPRCYLKGSVFVTYNAHRYLIEHLRDSSFSGENDINAMMKEFDERAKLTFRKSDEPLSIRFGGYRDTDPSKGIRAGQLKLQGSDVASFYSPSVRSILLSVMNMKATAKRPVQTVLLVGGFSSSDYLFTQVKEGLHAFGISVFRPDGHLNKVVADGAVSFYIDHHVDKRIARYTYGNPCSYIYNPADPEHSKRSCCAQGTQVSETTEFRRSYWFTGMHPDGMCRIKNEIYCYYGTIQNPRWMDIDKGQLSRLLPRQVRGKKRNRTVFYEMHYDLVLSFGLTELKAEIAWQENVMHVQHSRNASQDCTFPGQIHGAPGLKIPTVLYYDTNGVAQAVGAEAVQDSIDEIAKENGWKRASWFKLHLRPKLDDEEDVKDALEPLPPGVTIVDMFADLLRYLYRCTKEYIEQSHAAGDLLWSSLEKKTHFVLTHPNGWGGFEQAQMRRAAINAGLIDDHHVSERRLSFVTEGEASLNYCISSGLSEDAFKDGKGVVIVDAGGGTIDISAYARTSPEKNTYEEIVVPRCYLKGSVFLTHNARQHLRDSEFSDEDYINVMIKEFDERSKLTFRQSNGLLAIRFGGLKDKDQSKGISGGQLKLQGSRVASFFEPSVRSILDSVMEMKDNAKRPVQTVLFVGGFSSSDYLFTQVQEGLHAFGISVFRPDTYLNKVVANGAISFYIDPHVDKRIARYTYGNPCSYIYNPEDPEHLQRRSQVYTSPSSKQYIKGAFDVIVAKGTQVSETTEARRSYWYTGTNPDKMCQIKNDIYCYYGAIQNPKWIDVDKDSYFKLGVVEADTTRLSRLLPPQIRGKKKNRTVFYEMHYDIVLSFGLPELKAQIAWQEDVS